MMNLCVCILSRVWLCNLMDCSPLDYSVHGIFQARILDWVAISSFRGSSQSRDWTRVSCVSCIGRQILYCWAFTTEPRGKPRLTHINGLLSPRWWWLGKRLNHMGTEWFVGFWWVFFQPQLKINAYEFAGPKATCKIIVRLHVHTHTHTHTHTKPTSTHSAGHSYT